MWWSVVSFENLLPSDRISISAACSYCSCFWFDLSVIRNCTWSHPFVFDCTISTSTSVLCSLLATACETGEWIIDLRIATGFSLRIFWRIRRNRKFPKNFNKISLDEQEIHEIALIKFYLKFLVNGNKNMNINILKLFLPLVLSYGFRIITFFLIS